MYNELYIKFDIKYLTTALLKELLVRAKDRHRTKSLNETYKNIVDFANLRTNLEHDYVCLLYKDLSSLIAEYDIITI